LELNVLSPTSLTASLRRAGTTTTLGAAALAAALVLAGSSPQLAPVATSTPVTPGPITGYGFDQCETPSQTAMSAWHKYSPFRAVGIYMSGALRYCRDQPNLTPTWVHNQLAAGWRLLPIHLGRQANCTTVERYQTRRISADPTNNYAKARAQGVSEAKSAITAATNLGIRHWSTLFYDLESFDTSKTSCRVSALSFLDGWDDQLKSSSFHSGVYSSAATGIKMLDDARVDPDNRFSLPTYIWIAEWNDKRTTTSTYVRADGWPGRRLHQYHGGHDATYGGVTINIDSNYLDLHGFPTCTRDDVNRSSYRYTTPDVSRDLVTPLHCQLKKNGYYLHTVTDAWNTWTTSALNAFQKKVSHPIGNRVSRADWVALLSAGTSGAEISRGDSGAEVSRAQRALNAATSKGLIVNGVFGSSTYWATISYQRAVGIPATGRIGRWTWSYLTAGKY